MMRYTILLAGLVLVGTTKLASADVNYTLRYMEPNDVLSKYPETRILVKPGLRLEEHWMWHGTGYIKENTLTLFTQKQIVMMDANLKIYKILPFDQAAQDDKATVFVKNLGEEKILGFTPRHYQVDWKYDIPNAPPDADLNIRVDTWVVPSVGLKAYPTDSAPLDRQTITGDVDALEQSRNGLVVRLKASRPRKNAPTVYDEVYTEEISSLSRASIDDALFSIPDGYKQVSVEEYAQQQHIWAEKNLN